MTGPSRCSAIQASSCSSASSRGPLPEATTRDYASDRLQPRSDARDVCRDRTTEKRGLGRPCPRRCVSARALARGSCSDRRAIRARALRFPPFPLWSLGSGPARLEPGARMAQLFGQQADALTHGCRVAARRHFSVHSLSDWPSTSCHWTFVRRASRRPVQPSSEAIDSLWRFWQVKCVRQVGGRRRV